MENAPFAAYSGGHKAWSLWAKTIDLEHSPYSTASNVQSATLSDIRDGVLYGTSPTESILSLNSAPRPKPLFLPAAADPTAPLGPAAVRFHAKNGRYFVGSTQPLPGDLSANFSAHWQLNLSGDVAVQTRDGNSLNAESLTMMELTNLKTHRVEQRLECDSGATISRKGVKITANRLRYSLDDHTVELLDGVRGAFKEGDLQSQRTYWSLKDDIVQMPDPSTGILNGNRFSAESLTLYLKEGRQIANHFHIYFRTDMDKDNEFGSKLSPRASSYHRKRIQREPTGKPSPG